MLAFVTRGVLIVAQPVRYTACFFKLLPFVQLFVSHITQRIDAGRVVWRWAEPQGCGALRCDGVGTRAAAGQADRRTGEQ